MSGRLVLVGEGHGERGALENLVAKVGLRTPGFAETFVGFHPTQRRTIRGPHDAVRAAEVAARYAPAGVVLTADLDDDCPATCAPEWAAAVRARDLPVPVAVVLFHREYETLAISVAESLAGRELVPGLTLTAPREPLADPESRRDAKGWISANLMGRTRYKPTVHQLALTRLLDVDALRAARLSSFVRLESALGFLTAAALQGRAGVYPAESR